MKGIYAILGLVAVSLAAQGQDEKTWAVYGFLEGADLMTDVYTTDTEIGGGLGLSRDIRGKHGMGLEIFSGPNFSDNQSSNTFIHWKLDWRGIDLLYQYRWRGFTAIGGLGYAELVEERLGRDFEGVNQTRLEHHGPSLSLKLAWHFVPRAGVYLKYRRYVGSVKDAPHPRPALLADADDPDYIGVGVVWRFF